MTSETLTIEQYMGLSEAEQIDYIKTSFQLKDNYLVASVNRQHKGHNFFFANQLINPYTGEIITEKLFSNLSLTYQAFCPGFILADNDIHMNELILFSFTPNENIENIKKGTIVKIDNASITKVEHASILLEAFNISNHELLDMKLNPTFDKIGYISDFYRHHVKKIIDERVENILKLTNELDEKQAELEEVDTKLTKREQLLVNEQIKFDRHVAERNHLHNENIKRHRGNLEKEQQAVYAKLDKINEQIAMLGFPPLHTSEQATRRDETEQLTTPSEIEIDFIDAIHEQIYKRGLDYDHATIRQFYSALKTNQFTILSGPSGTGKTSLISAFAEVTSSLAKVIPVQPSWTDKQDLFGYYNPLDKQYVPSQLLDALIEARENQDRLYLICLDELNLAQIEYYFADILSLREQKNVPLELYSKYEYEQNMEEIEWFVQRALHEQADNPEAELDVLIENELNVATIDQFRYVQRYTNLRRYNWSMSIPENVRFIGTMNIDGTVRPLSPKVVDRSFIIPLERQKYDGKTVEEIVTFDLLYSDFAKQPETTADTTIIIERLMEKNGLLDIFGTLDAGINTRVENHLEQYTGIAQTHVVDTKTIYDELILLKLLPRINKMIDNDDSILENFKQTIKSLTGENGKSLQAVEKMIDKAEQTKIFSYGS